MAIDFGDGRLTSALTLLLAAGALYAACRAAIDAVAPADGSSPGRRALCEWIPIVTTALAAVFLHHPEVAVAVVFGTAVANLSLLFGLVTYLTPMDSTQPRRRAWAFVLPAALLSLMAGFGGALTWIHAIMLLVLGWAVLGVWNDDGRHSPAPSSGRAIPVAWHKWLQLILAIGLAAVGGWAVVRSTVLAAQASQMSSATLVVVTVLSPILTLPTLRTSVLVAERGNVEGALSALVGTVLLNLCLLLPVTVLLWYLSAPTAPAGATSGMPYPLGVWRVETVALVILGLLLTPIALGRWLLNRYESALLVLGYAIYLASIAMSARRL